MELVQTLWTKAGIATCCFSGQQNDKQKKDAREGFMEGRYRICIANQQSAAYGVNFMKNCDYTIYACSNSSVDMTIRAADVSFVDTTRMKYAYRLCWRFCWRAYLLFWTLGDDLHKVAKPTEEIFELGRRADENHMISERN